MNEKTLTLIEELNDVEYFRDELISALGITKAYYNDYRYLSLIGKEDFEFN